MQKQKQKVVLPKDKKLSPRQRKQLAEAVKKAKKNGKIAISAQDTISYKEMCPDGICVVRDGFYTKSIHFFDINYQLASDEDKDSIFSSYCKFLNHFDHSVRGQFSFLNQHLNVRDYEKSIHIPPQNDKFDYIREEYNEMLKNQLSRGKNGIEQMKYLTFGIEAENLAVAKRTLESIETDILNKFKSFGVRGYVLNGIERLEVLHKVMNQESNDILRFNWNMIAETGLSSKDFIAPSSFYFPKDNPQMFKMGKTFGAVSFMQIISTELWDDTLKDILKIETNLAVNIHFQSIDQTEAIKMVKRKLTDINKMKIDEQKKAVRSGYDMDILPSDINSYGGDALGLLEALQSHSERLFKITIFIMNTAKTRKQLELDVFKVQGICQQRNCPLRRLDFQQEDGLMASLPIGVNDIEIERVIPTRGLGIFIPFTTQEMFSDSKEALYYGVNALSKNMIMIDRKELPCPNGLFLGSPGSGKSFSAKREVTNTYLVTKDDIFICDPEAEYAPLARALDGQVVKLSTSSPDHINPMDINLNYSDGENPLALKSDFILSLCELIIADRNGLTPGEKSVIDRSVRRVYAKYFENPVPENMPILEDLYNVIKEQTDPEAQGVARALEMYVTGNLNQFNYRTNVDINNRLVCFDIKDLGSQLKKISMLVVQDAVWNKLTVNRYSGKHTRYYIDEFHLLLKEKQTAEYSVEIWKRFRKWGGIPTGITQNIKDFLRSDEIENIFENSDFVYLLSQGHDDRNLLAQKLCISPEQLSYVKDSAPGCGLLCCRNVIIPFEDKFPKDTKLYSLMTTKLEEVVKK